MWQALKPNGRSPFQVKKLQVDGPRKLFAMGFVTNLLNPKIAMLYLALLPQFIDPAVGSVLTQSLALGSIQIVISVSVNARSRSPQARSHAFSAHGRAGYCCSAG